MKKVVRILTVILALATVFSVLYAAELTAFAATAPDYAYTVLDDGTAEITKCNVSAGDLIIPSEIDGYKVTKIGANAFAENYVYTNVTVPDGVVSIGESAFESCRSIKTVTMPDGIADIGSRAFASCDKLLSINIPNSVQSIGSFAFGGCYTLMGINIPNGITEIAEGTFLNCYDLNDVTIPDSVTKIGANAFNSCEKLSKINIPRNVTSIAEDAFFTSYSLKSIDVDENNPAYCDVDGVLFSKDMTRLMLYPASGEAESYTIPDTVTRIEPGAFAISLYLKNVSIPDSVSYIGPSAFLDSQALESIVIPDGVTRIEYATFDWCISLKSVTLPDSITSIGERAFCACESLTEIVIPSGVTSIEASAFAECSSLTSINIPSNVTNLGESAFRLCTSLENIAIPNGITKLEYELFNGCTSLKSITIPNNITAIGPSAFRYCTALKDIKFPDNDRISIGRMAFEYCTAIESLVIPENVSYISEYAFSHCDALTTITLPDKDIDLVYHAFEYCPALKHVIIPAGVTKLNKEVFDSGSKFIIHGYRGSYAEAFAKSNKIPFAAIGEYPIISIESAASAFKPGMNRVEIVTANETWKLQIVYPDGSTRTFQPGSSSLVKIYDNFDGTKTWVVLIPFTKCGTQTLNIRTRAYGKPWSENIYSKDINVVPAKIESAETTPITVGGKFDLTVKVAENATKVQVKYASGATRTYLLSSAELIETADGYKTYKISGVPCTSEMQKSFTVLVRSAAGWAADGIAVG